jgi:hypothetical protein
MNQQQVRDYVERYFSAFSAHVMETHPAYLTLKLPVEVDKEIGNRPFYWSWVEKMNIPPQPLILTFFFDQEHVPQDMRGESIHFGANRLQQIFQSAKRHGRFVCMYERSNPLPGKALQPNRRSSPLTPWLGVNIKVSFICDKKRDKLLYLGVNLYQPRIVHDFYPFLQRLSLSPAIPPYHFTQERRITVAEAFAMVEQEVINIIAREDQSWADEANDRLAEELEILEAYYAEVASREKAEEQESGEMDDPPLEAAEQETESADINVLETPMEQAAPPVNLDEYRSGGGRILDFLRMHTIPETPKEQIDQSSWQKSTPEEEKERRVAELRWQYEPRIEVQVINGGLFFLHNMPPFSD